MEMTENFFNHPDVFLTVIKYIQRVEKKGLKERNTRDDNFTIEIEGRRKKDN